MNGVERIAAERRRQVERHGHDANHDREHHGGELARAASVYALPPEVREKKVWEVSVGKLLWPTDNSSFYWEFRPGERIRELEKAGALIAAEIDRLLALADGGE